ncbi:hypothetical protein BH18VER1_BH18VER1_05870 [soil metagenome]
MRHIDSLDRPVQAGFLRFIVGHFPGARADVDLNFIGDLDDNVVHEVLWGEFSGGAVFEFRERGDDPFVVLQILGIRMSTSEVALT